MTEVEEIMITKFSFEEKEVRKRDEIRIITGKNANDIGMRKRGKGNHTFNKDSMSFTTMFTDDSGNDDGKNTTTENDFTSIVSMKSPMMRRA